MFMTSHPSEQPNVTVIVALGTVAREVLPGKRLQ